MTTASSLERVLGCPGSEILSHTYGTREDADRGNSIHRFARRVLRGVAVSEALAHVAEKWQATCVGIDWDALAGGLTEIRSEHAFAIDVETQEVRFLGEDINRKYPPLGATEFAGSEDFSGIAADTLPTTTDVKTGWIPVTPVAENPQVMFFALRIHLDTGADRVRGRIAYIREDGRVFIDEHVFTRIELETFADELAELPARIAAARAELETTGTVTTYPDKYCRYCPAVSACPSKIALARNMAGEVGDMTRRLAVMTDEQKGVAWDKAKEIEGILGIVIDGLKDCAKQREFPSKGGAKTVKVISYPRSDFSSPKAIEMLYKLGATRDQVDACYNTRPVEQVRAVNAPKLPSARKPRKVKGRAA